MREAILNILLITLVIISVYYAYRLVKLFNWRKVFEKNQETSSIESNILRPDNISSRISTIILLLLVAIALIIVFVPA